MKKKLTTGEIWAELASRNLVMPYDLGAEKGLLGTLVTSSEARANVFGEWGHIDLDDSPFVTDEYTHIYHAIERLSDKGEPIDLVTICAELRTMGLAGKENIVRLSEAVIASAMPFHAERYFAILNSLHRRRKVIIGCERVRGLALMPEADEVDIRDEIEQILVETHSEVSHQSFREAVAEVTSQVIDPKANLKLRGILSGINELDRFTNGWQKENLITIAARSSRGKSTLALQFFIEGLLQGKHGVFYSLEMTVQELITRLLAYMTEIDSFDLRFGRLSAAEREKIREAGGSLAPLPGTILAPPSATPSQIRAELRRMKLKGKLDFCIVDYLQLLLPDRRYNDKEEELSAHAQYLKAASRELCIPIFEISQLNKEAIKENRAVRGSDSRGSEAIFNHSDLYVLIDDEYDRKNAQVSAPGERVMLILDKQRGGDTGNIPIKFNRATARFTDDYDRSEFPMNDAQKLARTPRLDITTAAASVQSRYERQDEMAF